MGGGGKTTNTTVQSGTENRDPWMGQQPFLSDAMQQAKNTYYQQQASPVNPYTGEFVAAPNADQIGTFQNLLSSSQGALTAANTSQQYGSAMAAGGDATANQAATGLFNLAASAGYNPAAAGLTGLAGQTWGQNNPAMGGLSGLSSAEWGADNPGKNLLNFYSTTDPTDWSIGAAGKYADNPYMSGMVDAAMRDARRTHEEVVTPGIDRNAAASGNINSTRTGIAQGIAERGLAEKTADVSAGLRGNAYSQGLTMAGQDWDRGLSAATNLGQLHHAGDTLTAGTQLGALGKMGDLSAEADRLTAGTQLGALTTLGNQSIAGNQTSLGALTAAGGLGTDLAKTGLFGIGQYGDLMQKSGDVANIANANISAFNQAPIDNALAKSNYAQAQPWTDLANYWNIVGDKSWGGTTTTQGSSMGTSATTPSTMSSVGMGVGLLGSLFRCDVRVKKNIFPVEGTVNGAQLYVFQYKDDPTGEWVVGPLAQEVEAIRPEAIVEINGIKHIDTNLFPWD